MVWRIKSRTEINGQEKRNAQILPDGTTVISHPNGDGELPKPTRKRVVRRGKGNPGGDPAHSRRDAPDAPEFDPLEHAKRVASRDRKEAPEDPEGREQYPGIYFLLAMHKTLADDFAEPGGFSVFCKGGLYHWTLALLASIPASWVRLQAFWTSWTTWRANIARGSRQKAS